MNKTEYNHIVKSLSHRVYAFMLKSTGDVDGAKDITQDSFLKLWEHKDNVDPDKARSWLFTTAHNLFLNGLRKEKYKQQHRSEIEIQNESQNFETKDLVNHCLGLLNEKQRSIILLRDLEGYNYDEIGEILDLTASQVKVYLFRARKKFKELVLAIERNANEIKTNITVNTIK